MPMTKAEKARLEELEVALALCWPAYAEPSPMTRGEIEAAKVEVKPNDSPMNRHRTRIALGWFHNAYNSDLTQGWSDGMYHSRHSTTGDHASQHMGRMYRTKREAAMAMRLEMSRDFARKLAAVDRVIRGEE